MFMVERICTMVKMAPYEHVPSSLRYVIKLTTKTFNFPRKDVTYIQKQVYGSSFVA